MQADCWWLGTCLDSWLPLCHLTMHLEKSLDYRSAAQNSLCNAIAASLCAAVALSLSLNPHISSESSEFPAHITCELQGAFFVTLSLPLSSEVPLLPTAHCWAYLTCSTLSSLPALPVPYGLLMSSYWNKETWLGLLTKQLLWKQRMLQF